MRHYLCVALALALVAPAAEAQTRDPDGFGAAAQLPEVAYVFESLSVRGNAKTRDFFFRNLLDLEAGERVRVEQLDRFRLRLLSTGFFSSVDARLAEGSENGAVEIAVSVEERNTIVVNDVFFGVSATESPFWGGLDLAETNLLGVGLLLRGAFVISSQQFGFRARVGDPFAAVAPFAWFAEGLYNAAAGRGPSLTSQGLPATLSFEYERGGGRLGVGFAPLARLGIGLDYRIESLDFRYTDRGTPLPYTGFQEGRSLLSNLGLSFEYDALDRPGLPTAGYRVGLRVDGGAGFTGSDYTYIRLVGQAEAAVEYAHKQTLRFGLAGGALFAEDDRAPYFEGFYVGDVSELVAGRDLELQFTDRRSLDLLNNSADLVTYGDGFGLIRGEWAYEITPIYGSLNRVEAFISAGLWAIDQGPWQIGRPPAAVTSDRDYSVEGLHYDLTFNFGVRAATPVGDFELSIGQALSLAPLD